MAFKNSVPEIFWVTTWNVEQQHVRAQINKTPGVDSIVDSKQPTQADKSSPTTPSSANRHPRSDIMYYVYIYI